MLAYIQENIFIVIPASLGAAGLLFLFIRFFINIGRTAKATEKTAKELEDFLSILQKNQ